MKFIVEETVKGVGRRYKNKNYCLSCWRTFLEAFFCRNTVNAFDTWCVVALIISLGYIDIGFLWSRGSTKALQG